MPGEVSEQELLSQVVPGPAPFMTPPPPPAPSTWGNSAKIGYILVEVTIGIKWAQAKDAAEWPVMQRTAPTTQSYSAQNVSTAPGEKHWFRGNC